MYLSCVALTTYIPVGVTPAYGQFSDRLLELPLPHSLPLDFKLLTL
jgi:hypothetical protein